MFIRWLQSMFAPTPATTPEVGQAQAPGALTDIFHEVAKGEETNLRHLVAMGLPKLRQRRHRERVRKKVSAAIANGCDDAGLVDDITERILDVEQFDPYYRKLFSDEEIK